MYLLIMVIKSLGISSSLIALIIFTDYGSVIGAGPCEGGSAMLRTPAGHRVRRAVGLTSPACGSCPPAPCR
jgi:hypothetical protein